VENRLKELVGEAAGRLHTARSRNDQVATDFKLWVRNQMDASIEGLGALIGALLTQAEAGADMVMPGFTHLQVAQPVTWGHHMMAYVEMFARDRARFRDARARANECPLGAAALAGTSFPIDRHMTASALGFDRPAANSLDAVSDRDFVIERSFRHRLERNDVERGQMTTVYLIFIQNLFYSGFQGIQIQHIGREKPDEIPDPCLREHGRTRKKNGIDDCRTARRQPYA